jgi:hypothetical protein
MNNIILYPSKKSLNRIKIIGDIETVLDDGVITLPTGVTGRLEVIFINASNAVVEWGTVIISADGSGEIVNCKDANLHLADDDGFYCVYDGGTGAVIKPRVGAPIKILWEFHCG